MPVRWQTVDGPRGQALRVSISDAVAETAVISATPAAVALVADGKEYILTILPRAAGEAEEGEEPAPEGGILAITFPDGPTVTLPDLGEVAPLAKPE